MMKNTPVWAVMRLAESGDDGDVLVCVELSQAEAEAVMSRIEGKNFHNPSICKHYVSLFHLSGSKEEGLMG